MKIQNIYHLLQAALLLLLVSCTQEEFPAVQDKAQQLTISVTDGGYTSAVENMKTRVETRAVENGYTTEFTEGDACGFYMVRGGKPVYSNVKLTAEKDAATGGIMWKTDGTTLAAGMDGESYYLYYPYQADMAGKTATPAEGAVMTDAEFFKPLIDGWQPGDDQSTHAAYTASDLMTARGVYNNHTLSFAMEHRMSLLILQVPATKYTYTEKIDGREISKSYYRYTAVISENSYWQENPCTARLLLNTTDPTHLNPEPYEYYYNGTKETFNLKYSQLNLQPGKYTVHTLDDSKVTEESRSLKAGDYYMQDGSILPGVLCQCFQNVSGLVERELPGRAVCRQARQQPLCTEHKARAAHSLLCLRRKGFPFSAAHADQCDHCKISLQYAKICVSVSPVSGGRRSTTSCAPVSAAACTFSAKPPAAPPSLVTRYRIWNCVINALFSARLNGPCMAMMFRCGTLAASQAAMPSGVGRTRG